ncbi:MAG: YncE family protein [Planctomycetes bacterium]|nr:YncE family protein [Planctomycetota bacterium]
MRKLAMLVSFAVGTLTLTTTSVLGADAPAGTKVYVSNSDSSSVGVIDANATQGGAKKEPRAAILRTVGSGSEPRGLAGTPDGAFIYVTNRFGSSIPGPGGPTTLPSVSVIETATDTSVGDIAVTGLEPYNLAITPDGTRVYVVCTGSSTVSVISRTTNAEVASIALPTASSPEGIAITADGAKVYVVGRQSNTVDVIATASNTVIAQGITVGSNPRDAAVSSDGTRVIVVGDGVPAIILTATDTRADTGLSGVGPQRDVAVAGNFAYVTNFSLDLPAPAKKTPRASGGSSGPSLDIYDLTDNSYAGSIAVSGVKPYGVALLPDGSTAYVSCQDSNEVRVIDLVAKTETGESVAVGNSPRGVALISPNAIDVPSYLLPRSLRLTLKEGAHDSMVTRGTFDDGGVSLDFTQPVTIDIGGFSRTFTLLATRTEYLSPKESGVALRVKPGVKGSSRGKFRLSLKNTELDQKVDPNAPLLIRLAASGAPAVRGRVKLTAGFFRIGKASGDILEPAFFPRRATVALADGANDVLALQGGFATSGVVPQTISSVKIGFGPTFTRTIAGRDFTSKAGAFTYVEKGDAGMQLTVKVDFRKDIVTINAKKIELGALTSPRIDIVFGNGSSPSVATNSVRLGVKGNRRYY